VRSRNLLFRVSHRFVPTTESGYESFYGLNGPAFILLGLGYGITDDLSVMLTHSNLFHEYELMASWLAFEEGELPYLPLTLKLEAGGSLVTQTDPGEDVWRSENMKFTTTAILGKRVGDRLSVLVAPAYSTNTNHWESPSDDTFALGIGGRLAITDALSLIGEWTSVLDGYQTDFDEWGAGIEYEIGGHVFQVLVTDSFGLTTDQYLPGGDLEFAEGDVRIGFNIFRTFWF